MEDKLEEIFHYTKEQFEPISQRFEELSSQLGGVQGLVDRIEKKLDIAIEQGVSLFEGFFSIVICIIFVSRVH
ncbi:hypothetical protein [Paenibacillus sp. OAE614]|uniref:hypothetical protein n=1 Tax=Paenibacillus sp. OAE614 TaxID=2663804 RepID=UPI00178A3808